MQASADTIVVSAIGTSSADGSPSPTPGTMVQTPANVANIKLNFISPIIALIVRFGHEFFTTFLGLLTAAGIGVGTTEVHVQLHAVVVSAAWASLVVAGVGLVKNAITVFSKLEGKYPLATGSI